MCSGRNVTSAAAAPAEYNQALDSGSFRPGEAPAPCRVGPKTDPPHTSPPQENAILRQLEAATQVRLEIVELPGSIDGVPADSLRFGHESPIPMNHACRLALQGRLNDIVSFALVELRPASSEVARFFRTRR